MTQHILNEKDMNHLLNKLYAFVKLITVIPRMMLKVLIYLKIKKAMLKFIDALIDMQTERIKELAKLSTMLNTGKLAKPISVDCVLCKKQNGECDKGEDGCSSQEKE